MIRPVFFCAGRRDTGGDRFCHGVQPACIEGSGIAYRNTLCTDS